MFLQKHTTAEKLAQAINKSPGGRGGFNMKIKKNNQLSTGWYHSEGQYVAALRLAFLTEKKVRPPTPRPLGCFLLTPVQAREPRPGCRCHPHHATAATENVQGLPRVVREGAPGRGEGGGRGDALVAGVGP